MVESFSRVTFACSFAMMLTIAASLAAQEVSSELKTNAPAAFGDDEADLFDDGPLPRGPVHEAFAEPVQLTPIASPIVGEAPPVAVTETPANRPAGKDLEWINGYWGWNEDVERYLWVSGVWRKAPPGRRWEVGTWAQVDGGYQWVPGNWLPKNTETAEVSGFQNVPTSLEAGPNQPEPENSFWVPGAWKPADETPAKTPAKTPRGVSDGYSWRPGSWSNAHDDWVWVPEHYSWTPEGSRMVAGYWDYAWSVRGTLHACCAKPSENYQPVAINTEDRFTKLWTNPQTGSYYYGDYAEENPIYVPWHQYHVKNMGYDPLYCHYSRIVGPRVGGDFCSYLDSRYAYRRRTGGGGVGRMLRSAAPAAGTAAALSGGSTGAATIVGGSAAPQVVTTASPGPSGPPSATSAATDSGAASPGANATNQPSTAGNQLSNAANDAASSIPNPLDNVSGEGDDEGESGSAPEGGSASSIGGGAAAAGGAAGAAGGLKKP